MSAPYNMWRLCFVGVIVAACPKFQCSETVDMKCVQETQEGFVSHPCPDNYQCPVVPFGKVAPADCLASSPTAVSSAPVCVLYLEEGDVCLSTKDCQRSFYCTANSTGIHVCTKVKRLGHQCVENIECREGTVCNKGRCIQLFSLNEKDEADTKTACKSLRIKGGVCQKESLTVGELPKPCVSDSDCTSSIGLPGECQCGANPEGQGYCALHESDEPVRKYLNAVRNVEVEEAAMQAIKMAHYPVIKGTEDCWDHIIKEVVDYETREDIYEQCSATALFFVVFSLLA